MCIHKRRETFKFSIIAYFTFCTRIYLYKYFLQFWLICYRSDGHETLESTHFHRRTECFSLRRKTVAQSHGEMTGYETWPPHLEMQIVIDLFFFPSLLNSLSYGTDVNLKIEFKRFRLVYFEWWIWIMSLPALAVRQIACPPLCPTRSRWRWRGAVPGCHKRTHTYTHTHMHTHTHALVTGNGKICGENGENLFYTMKVLADEGPCRF